MESEAFNKNIERVERNIKRCDKIIDEMLDFTRTTNISLQPFKFDRWLDRVLDEIDLPKGIKVERQFNSGDARVEIDTDRMQRAVINIMANAWQAMLRPDCEEPGQVIPGARLQISTSANNERVTTTFTDNGCGMNEEVLEQVFEPLFSTKGFGVGLGMPTIQQILNQHRGGISITSEENRGTTVTMWLPRSSARPAN